VVTPDAGAGAQPGKRQRLGAELRRARELGGLSGRELAQRIGISQSKVSRAESGSTLLSMPQVAAWASATGASPDVADLLCALTEAAYTEVHNWGTMFRDRPHIQGDIQSLEERARKILTFQPSVVPGLLQTAEYARRVFAMFQPPYLEQEIPEVLAARLDRQVALFRARQRFDFLITEAALRWRPGPAPVLQAQLDRISSLSTLDNVSVGVIPLSAEAVTNTSHGFVLFEMMEHDESDAMVLVDTIHANLVVNDPESVALYRTRWSLLEQMALHGDEARSFLAFLASDIRKNLTLIKPGALRQGGGDAARRGALHPLGVPRGSDGVELARLDGPDKLTPFGHVEVQGRPAGVLGVANRDDFELADLYARTAALAAAGKAAHLIRDSRHETFLSGFRRGVSAPAMRKASRGHLAYGRGRERGRALFFSCSACRPCARTRTPRVRGIRPI
jgi:transcriptional regulator with XRE-family HTH domain